MRLLVWTLLVLRYASHLLVLTVLHEPPLTHLLPQRARKSDIDPNVRHSFNGSDVQLDFTTSTPTATNQPQFALSPGEPPRTSRMNGHVRSGSAGNWATATRSNNAPGSLTAYPLSSIPGGELKNNLPWADFAGSRRNEPSWP